MTLVAHHPLLSRPFFGRPVRNRAPTARACRREERKGGANGDTGQDHVDEIGSHLLRSGHGRRHGRVLVRPATHASTSTSVTRTTGSAVTTTSSSPASATQTAVLNAWESAEQTLYSYLQGSWQQDRADLVGGETSANLWPKLADYFTNPALQSEDEFLVGVKMGQLNGPTTYNLGHPTVSAVTPTSATVTACIYDTGTTTASGQPGPPTLGGGAGYAAELGNFSSSTGRGRSPTFTR